MSPQEHDLDAHLDAIQRGDSHAFAAWMARAEPRLRAWLRPFAAVADVEAVLQEALLRTWQFAPQVKVDGKANSLLRVAHRMARNLAVSEARRLRTANVEPEDLERLGAEEEPGPAPPDPLLRATLSRCHEGLPEKPAQALRARVEAAGGEDDHRLAERLGMKLNTFLQNFTRARKLLVECLARAGIDVDKELG